MKSKFGSTIIARFQSFTLYIFFKYITAYLKGYHFKRNNLQLLQCTIVNLKRVGENFYLVFESLLSNSFIIYNTLIIFSANAFTKKIIDHSSLVALPISSTIVIVYEDYRISFVIIQYCLVNAKFTLTFKKKSFKTSF